MAMASEGRQTEILIDVAVLAKKLCVHEVTIRKWQSSGKIPAPVRIGRAVKWRLAEIDAWIAAKCPTLARWEAMNAAPPKGRR
jgi:Predicted transcriptional regulator